MTSLSIVCSVNCISDWLAWTAVVATVEVERIDRYIRNTEISRTACKHTKHRHCHGLEWRLWSGSQRATPCKQGLVFCNLNWRIRTRIFVFHWIQSGMSPHPHIPVGYSSIGLTSTSFISHGSIRFLVQFSSGDLFARAFWFFLDNDESHQYVPSSFKTWHRKYNYFD